MMAVGFTALIPSVPTILALPMPFQTLVFALGFIQ